MLLTMFSLNTMAQSKMADAMRQDGKIYVVIGVISIIFLLILSYLVMIDRRLSKAEKERK